MPNELSSNAVFERHFLETRSKLLEIAATLDRIDRAADWASVDPRTVTIHDAFQILAGAEPDRAERLQLLFSLPYDPKWIDDLDFTARRNSR